MALPPELQFLIFSRLLRVQSVCLGLTCKKFYNIHKTLYPAPGEVRLSELGGYDSYLGDLLNNWAGPNLCFEIRFDIAQFITIGEWTRHAQKWEEDSSIKELMTLLWEKQAGKVIPWERIARRRERPSLDDPIDMMMYGLGWKQPKEMDRFHKARFNEID